MGAGDRGTAASEISAAWRHLGAREGFEVLFLRHTGSGVTLDGQATGVEDGQPWAVRYSILAGADWVTRRAELTELSAGGERHLVLEHDGDGHWTLDDAAARGLDGCVDVDLEASVCTNALPARRLGLAVGDSAGARSAWVRTPGLTVEPLAQSYARLPDDDACRRYDYRAPSVGYAGVLTYDELGLVLEYPRLAARVL